jgi:cytochrome P450
MYSANDPQMIGEILRYESPVQAIFRSAISDTTIAGVSIAAGDRILIFYGSANRDERKFPHPDLLRLRVTLRTIWASGSGFTICIGTPLARLEVRIAIDALLRCFPNIRARDQKRVWVDSFVVRGPSMLPLELH